MSLSNLYFFEVESWEKEIIKRDFSKSHCLLFEGHIQDYPIEKIQDCEILSSFVFSSLDQSLLEKLSKLKMIATRSTGVDHVDLDFCKRKNIHVANVPLYGEKTVAEHTFALLLALTRKLISSVERTRSGSFSLDGLCGEDLNQKTIGIIGTGNIGQQVAKIANAFEMKILAHDIRPNLTLVQKFGVQYVSFKELLKHSDIITLHVPANDSTYHLINQSHLPNIKKGAILINTARGSVVETEALVKGLSEKIFSGLGLDVLEQEPKIREERELLSTLFQGDLKTVTTTLANEFLLHHHENVIITPHNGFNTKQALERILKTTLENIKEFLENGKRFNSVIS